MLPFLLAQAAMSVMVLLIAAMACLLLKRSSAALRHFVWLLAFASLLAIPICANLFARLMPESSALNRKPVVTVTIGNSEPASLTPPSQNTSNEIPWEEIATGVWLLGAAVVIIRMACGVYKCSVRRRGAEPLYSPVVQGVHERLRLAEPVDVLVSDDVRIPETFGLRSPAVLLPAESRSWSVERLRIVLLHECVHVQRRDWAVHLLARTATAFFWFNPLSWYALRRLYDERERACDDCVLHCGIAQSEYARELFEIAKAVRNHAESFTVAMSRPGHLETRIHSILDSKSNRRSLTLKHGIFALVPAALLVVAASLITAPAVAQTGNASITGIVRDPSGATVPSAEVVLSNGRGREVARTDEVGKFEFSGFADGKYSLRVMKPGFRMFEKQDMEISSASRNELAVVLDMGRLSERVTVTAKGDPRPQPPIQSTALQPAAQAVEPDSKKQSAPVQTESSGTGGPKRIRVGGNVHAAKLINSAPPKYPEHLIAQGVEGTVILEAVIGLQGQVLSLKPANSQVHPDLIQAALDAVSLWTYQPTLLNGSPIEIATTITVDFQLKQ